MQCLFVMNGNKRRERHVHLQRAEKNAENEMFIFNEQKRTQRIKRLFSMNEKERRERNVYFQ